MFAKGYGAINNEVKKMEEEREARKNEPFKFRLKNNETHEVTFLEQDPTVFYEHRFQEGDNWKDAETKVCIQDIVGKCPGCAKGNKRQIKAAFTVIDMTPFVMKDGKTIKSQKKLLILNARAAETLSKLGNIKGYRIAISRGSDPKDASTGSSFMKVMDAEDKAVKYDLDQMATKGVDVKPFDYEAVIKVDSFEEFNNFVNPKSFDSNEGFSDKKTEKASNQKPSASTPDMDDDVPF